MESQHRLYENDDEGNLPSEIILMERILDSGITVLTIAGVAIQGTTRDVEVCNMRNEVILRVPVANIAAWVERHHYRYVPRTRGIYQRESSRARVPVAAPALALPAPVSEHSPA